MTYAYDDVLSFSVGGRFYISFADSGLYNRQTSTAAEVHKEIGVHLKLAPYREGGAGKEPI